MQELQGRQIGLAADRKSDALGEIIRKKGGTPVIKSIQGQRLLNEKRAEEDVEQLIKHPYDWVILTTGIGAEALEKAAERLGRKEQLIEILGKVKLAIRGSKTRNWLKTWQLEPAFVSPDGTMNELIEGLKTRGIEDKGFFFQAYNKDEERLIKQLESLPVSLYVSLPYYYLPPDSDTLAELRTAILDQTLNAVVFTSKTQVQNLFSDFEGAQKLAESFQDKVVAVAVGKVTAQTLRHYGVNRIVEPENPKMGAMIIELANYYKQQAEL